MLPSFAANKPAFPAALSTKDIGSDVMGKPLCKAMVCCLTVISISGCAEEPTRFPVAGTVLIDGEPLTTGSIQFVPEGGRPAASKIGEDGSFRLMEVSVAEKPKPPGVVAGKYRIGVSSAEIVNEDEDEVLRHIPRKYADFRTSELEVEINEPKEDMVIELTWAGMEEDDETATAEATGEGTEQVAEETVEDATEELENDEAELETEAVEQE